MNLSSEGSPGHRWRVCSEGLVFHTCFPSFGFLAKKQNWLVSNGMEFLKLQ